MSAISEEQILVTMLMVAFIWYIGITSPKFLGSTVMEHYIMQLIFRQLVRSTTREKSEKCGLGV